MRRKRGKGGINKVIFTYRHSTGPVLRITQYGAITWRGQESNYESWEELTTRSPQGEMIAAKKIGKGALVCKCVLVCEHDGASQRGNIINLPSCPFTPDAITPCSSKLFMLSSHMM